MTNIAFGSIQSQNFETENASIRTKVPPIDRARQGELNHTRQASAKPKPAIKDASKIAKTHIFATPLARNGDAAKTATRSSV